MRYVFVFCQIRNFKQLYFLFVWIVLGLVLKFHNYTIFFFQIFQDIPLSGFEVKHVEYF